MFLQYVDQTIMDLIAILISGVGLFAVLTKYYVPELNSTFLGENPFAIKRDKIDNTTTWLFICLTFIGILIQISSIIFGSNLPKRLYSDKFYLLTFIMGTALASFIVFCLDCMGKRIARGKWFPIVINKHKDSLNHAIFIIEHDGWRMDQIGLKYTNAETEEYKSKNYNEVEKIISMIEKLLDLPKGDNGLKERAEKLREYFK